MTLTTATAPGPRRSSPNLVDTLTPTPDGTNKTVGQAKISVDIGAGFTGAATTNPAGGANTLIVSNQSQPAYTCQNANSTVVVTAP